MHIIFLNTMFTTKIEQEKERKLRRKRMMPPLLFQLMILLSWSINSLAKSPATAKLNCPSSCGNVSIPYPFGIGSKCYLDSLYAVDCSSNKPILNSFHLEVLEISLESSTIVVNHPVLRTCQNRETKQIVNLENTPFFFSRDKNRFTGVGCNNFAYMYSSSANSIISGCLSVCENSANTAETMSCYGIKCCQTRIPSPLKFQVFNASIDAINYQDERQKEKCKYAFLVKQDWFEEYIKSPDTIQRYEYVPVVLDWGIINRWIDRLVIRNSSRTYLSTSNCRIYSSSPFKVSQCKCLKGFEGNPYFFQGCQDIDECEVRNKTICQSNGHNCKLESTNSCPSNMSCLNTYGNVLCYPPQILSPTKSKVKMLMLGFGIGVGSLILLIGVWWLYIVNKRRKDIKLKEMYFKRNGGLLLEQRLTSFDGSVDKEKLFNSRELDKATDHFNVNRILGKGGQGTVYKGMLTDGRIVAVKKSIVDEGKLEEFINEVTILSHINHRNVVKLLGCCLETEIPLLVYEFIPNGTLYQRLHNQNEEFLLTWEMRLQIAIEVAGALSYLHSAASLPIYHRDIKSANILLDDMYRAKVADFGTSRSIAIDQTHVTTKVQGTFGYLDPEFFQTSQFSDKSDVYSFGVVLVELLTGQKPICSTRSNDFASLATLFILSMLENSLLEILDPEVRKLGKIEDIMTVANLAKRCLNLSGKRRPTMQEVVMVLEGIRASMKRSNIQQNCEEVEYMRTELVAP